VIGFLAVLWALYLSDCFVRWRPGDWVFRPRIAGGMEAVSVPDLTFLGGRFAFVWTSVLPSRTAHVFSGRALESPDALLERVREQSWSLRAFSTGLFAVVMVAFPALVLTEWFSPSVPLLVLAFGVAWAGALATYVVAHRRVHGALPTLESWLVLALSPLSLIRAPHAIAGAVSRQTHPAVAADALCGDEEFLRIARLWHFDAPDLRSGIEHLAERRGLRERLTAPPPATEPGVTLFCRRCHATFKAAAQRCADCEDVELAPLPFATTHHVART
jgi:hypothetical protein